MLLGCVELSDFPLDIWEIVILSVLQSPINEEFCPMPQKSLLRNNSDVRRGRELREQAVRTEPLGVDEAEANSFLPQVPLSPH